MDLIHLHLAATDVTGRVAVLEGREIAPGESSLVQIVLDEPVGALWGDRLILRDQSARRTVAGGKAIDPFATARGRSRPNGLATLRRLRFLTRSMPCALCSNKHPPASNSSRARSRNLSPAEATELWRGVEMNRIGRPEAPIGVSQARWDTLSEETVTALADWHKAHPGDPGPTEDQLRLRLPVSNRWRPFGAILLGLD